MSDEGLAQSRDLSDSTYSDDAGRPIGEYLPSALERLNRLHNESVETARLANLLGRVPFAAAILSAGCVLVVVASLGLGAPFMLGTWTALVLTAVVALIRVERHAVSSEFELLPLRAFALDLNAVMIYAGFAWGSGAFLAFGTAAETPSLVLFTLGAAAAMGAVMRARNATLYFLVPNIALGALAAYFSSGLGAASVIALCGLVTIAVTETLERVATRRAYAPVLSPLTLS